MGRGDGGRQRRRDSSTCTRATEPLFDGGLVRPGAFVAAVGSSKPAARELDDALLARAALIAVEWLPAAEAEAGEFRRAAPGVIEPGRVAELGALLNKPRLRSAGDITVYKSVGIGLEDVALAQLVCQRWPAASAHEHEHEQAPARPRGGGRLPVPGRLRRAPARPRPLPDEVRQAMAQAGLPLSALGVVAYPLDDRLGPCA